MMKKHLTIAIITVLLFFTGGILQAQTNRQDQDLTFVYLCCDFSIDKGQLTQIISETFNDNRDIYNKERSNPHIFYLSDNMNPKVIFMNVDTLRNNEENFEEYILGTLNSPINHNVMPRFDVDSIVEIFNAIDFIDEDGNLTYNKLTMEFYVSETFWSREYNVSLISYLYWVLGLDKYVPAGQIDLNVWYSRTDTEYIDESSYFGKMNLLDINSEKNVWVNSFND